MRNWNPGLLFFEIPETFAITNNSNKIKTTFEILRKSSLRQKIMDHRLERCRDADHKRVAFKITDGWPYIIIRYGSIKTTFLELWNMLGKSLKIISLCDTVSRINSTRLCGHTERERVRERKALKNVYRHKKKRKKKTFQGRWWNTNNRRFVVFTILTGSYLHFHHVIQIDGALWRRRRIVGSRFVL